MKEALRMAKKGAHRDEVPIGAILVKDDKIVSRATNLTRFRRDPTAHAEIVVLQQASKKLRNERLTGSSLYVTLEPCAMCAGALVQARVSTVVFGAKDPKAGACGSVLRVIPNRKLNHRPVLIKDVLSSSSRRLLREFFKKKRR